jgi:hypothetical protein
VRGRIAGIWREVRRDRRGVLSKMFDAKLGSDDRIFRLQHSPAETCAF